MGRRAEQTFFQRKHTVGQQVHEKELNIIKHEGMQIKSTMRLTPHTCQNGDHQKDKEDFPGGAVVKNPPANAGDMGSSPGPGRSHMQWSN